MMFLIVSCILSVIGGLRPEEISSTTVNSTTLVEKIRRQLMRNNYDYLPSDSEDVLPIVRRAHDDQPARKPEPYYDYINQNKEINHDKPTNNDLAILRAQEEYGYDYINQSRKEEDVVSKNDLLYYLDDEKLRKDRELESSNPSDVSFYSDIYDSNHTTEKSTNPTIKYKVLRVKDPHPSRRSLSFRLFIKEESPGGLALTNLDPLPFPQFRLPPERRQYMHDQHDAQDKDIDDLDIEINPGSFKRRRNKH